MCNGPPRRDLHFRFKIALHASRASCSDFQNRSIGKSVGCSIWRMKLRGTRHCHQQTPAREKNRKKCANAESYMVTDYSPWSSRSHGPPEVFWYSTNRYVEFQSDDSSGSPTMGPFRGSPDSVGVLFPVKSEDLESIQGGVLAQL